MCICLYVCHIIWSGTIRGWKRMLDLLELELQVVSNPVWVLGTELGLSEEQQVLLLSPLLSMFCCFRQCLK